VNLAFLVDVQYGHILWEGGTPVQHGMFVSQAFRISTMELSQSSQIGAD